MFDRSIKADGPLANLNLKKRITAKASVGRSTALGLRHIGLFEAPSPSSANYRAGGVMSLSGQRLAFCTLYAKQTRQE